VTWHSFYMNAGLPKKGIDSMADFRRQYGDATANMLAGRVQAIGEAEGLNLRNIGKRGHTKNAHRLIQLGRSKSPEMQNRVVTELYKSYWGEDGDITDFGMLTECGVKAGLDRDEVKKWLEGGEGGAEVDKEVRDALRKGIHAVPNYNINGEYSLDGAQEPQTFVQAFVKAKNSENPNVSAGGSCPI
jgi:predicted DsbA family dithiol-disulfide isomerase